MGQTSRWWEVAGCGKFSWTATRQIPWHRRKESYGMSGLKHHPGADVGRRKGVTSSYTLQTAGGYHPYERGGRISLSRLTGFRMYRPCRRGKTAWICHCAIFWKRIIHAQVEDEKSLRASWTLDVASLQQLTRHVWPETSPMRTGKTENLKIC